MAQMPRFSDLQLSVMKEDFEKTREFALALIEADIPKEQKQQAQYYFGLSELRLGQFNSAEKIFKELIKEKLTDELYDKASLGLFDTLYLDGQYEKAHKAIKKLHKKRPMSEFLSLIYLKEARVNLKLTQWQQARELLKKIVEHFPNSIEFHTAKQLLEEKQFFAVQVGSFLEVERAKSLAEELKAQGEYAYVLETESIDGKKFYRVRVGQSSILAEAQELEKKLSESGYPTLIYP